MRSEKLMARLATCFGLLLFFAVAAAADTIVLKNGRRIVALSVTELADKIEYETASGTLSLPKSIVDHIERGGAPGSYAQAAANLAITAPPLESMGIASANGVVEQGAVHDGMIDRGFIAKLEGEARSGNRADRESAALAHHVAAQFEMTHGDMDHALADEHTALNFAPDQMPLLLNVAYMHLRRSEFKQSLDYLDRARRVAPNNADVAKLAGWAYYGLNKLDQAVAEWERALAIQADPEVQAALEKAKKDKAEEESYKENESAHFTLRYNGSAEPALAREVLRTLEAQYGEIESELRFSTPDSVGVILYTKQAFADITNAPNWVGALNDGRIRVPVQGLTGMTPDLARVLKHELTHSFVQQKTHGRAPTWMQEGIAQWMEGKRSNMSAAALLQIYDAKQSLSLSEIEGSWMQFAGDKSSIAYAWSLANVEAIVQTAGMGEIESVLDRIAAGEATESALRNVVHSDYNDLMQATAEYLRKTYAH
jgi:tetratricopeptide (TPR) repeat protein